jgi:type I restriction enzyme S subunit
MVRISSSELLCTSEDLESLEAGVARRFLSISSEVLKAQFHWLWRGHYYEKGTLSNLGVEVGRLVPADSVLMVSIGGSIGKVGIVDRECSCNQQINYITLQNGVIPKLLYYYLKSPYFQEQVLSLAPKTTLPILSKGKWDLIPLPLPPLAEQKRIVVKVNQLMALCDELEAKLRQAEADSEKLMSAAVQHVLAAISDRSTKTLAEIPA